MASNYDMHTVDVHGLLLNDTAAALYHSNHSNHSNHSMLLTVNLLLQTVRESSIHIHSHVVRMAPYELHTRTHVCQSKN